MKAILRSTVSLRPVSLRSFSTVQGEYKQHGTLNMERLYVGQMLDPNFEVTIGTGWREMWGGSFFSFSRLNTSKAFAAGLGFKNPLLPFSFLLNHAVGMSHVDETREVLDLGFENGRYVRPAFAGDTLRKQFMVKKIRNASNNIDAVVTFQCNLLNADQKDALVFAVDKTMLFRGQATPVLRKAHPHNNLSTNSKVRESRLRQLIMDQAWALPSAVSVAPLYTGLLLLHGLARPLGASNAMSLSSLFSMTHPTIFNSHLHGEELVVPGALVAAMTISCASREMHEKLHMNLASCQFLNKSFPSDTIGAMTFVTGIVEMDGDMEDVSCVTVGVKNTDVPSLAGLDLPAELFHPSTSRVTTVEEMVAGTVLEGKVVIKLHYNFIRKASSGHNMALL